MFDIGGEDDIAEGLPVLRAKGAKAWLSIMHGCKQFLYLLYRALCPRQRAFRDTRRRLKKSCANWLPRATERLPFLGQNVNSYGKDLDIDAHFSDLLRRLKRRARRLLAAFYDKSHPKDASPKLFSAMAECDKVAKQLHLPFQSGSDEILRRMNRRYTAKH